MPPTSNRRRPKQAKKTETPAAATVPAKKPQRTYVPQGAKQPKPKTPDYWHPRSTKLPPLPEKYVEEETDGRGKALTYEITTKEHRAIAQRAITAAKDPEFFPDVEHYTRRLFLSAYMELCNKTAAAKAIGISQWTPASVQWRNDPEFQDAMVMAHAVAADALEGEAYRRGVLGVEEPTGWYKGAPGGYVKKYSDVLLIFLLKGALPDKYKDRVEMRSLLANIDMDKLPQEAVERIAGGEHILAVLADLAERERKLLPSGSPTPEEDV